MSDYVRKKCVRFKIPQNIIEKFNKMHIEVINTLFNEEVLDNCNVAVYYLGKSISAMKDL